jgi:hypothetical protein
LEDALPVKLEDEGQESRVLDDLSLLISEGMDLVKTVNGCVDHEMISRPAKTKNCVVSSPRCDVRDALPSNPNRRKEGLSESGVKTRDVDVEFSVNKIA